MYDVRVPYILGERLNSDFYKKTLWAVRCLFAIKQVMRNLSSLVFGSFVLHKNSPSLVTLKIKKVWLLRLKLKSQI